MAISWNIPTEADYTIGTNVPDDILAAINAHFVANSGGGSAVWEVATYSSVSPRYIILRRKSLAAGRIIIFGQQGSTANAAAVRAAGVASHIYIGYSKTSTATTEDASWLSGAPLSASDYITAVEFMPVSLASSTMHFTYVENSTGVWFIASVNATGLAVSGAGELIVDPSGADVSCISGNGTGMGTTWATQTSASGAIFNPIVATDTYTTGNPGLVCRLSSANHLCYRVFAMNILLTSGNMFDSGSLKAWFLPIPIICSSTFTADGIVGKFKQVAYGPNCPRDTRWNLTGTGTRDAYGAGYNTVTQIAGLWFLEFDI
jgi:hypothetical protein